MTLLLREMGRFLIGSGLWIVALAAVTTVFAAPILWGAKRRVEVRDLGMALGGAAALAALGHRIEAITGWSPDVGGRPLPIVWVAVGAAATAVALVLVRRATART